MESKKKILIVDDEKNIRIVLSVCLEEENYSVKAVENGADALKTIAEESFSLILLDMKLPDIDGLVVLERIVELNPAQRVIMITAHGSIETAVEAMKRGAVDYLQKPFTPDDIRSIVKHHDDEKAKAAKEDTLEKCIALARRNIEQKQLEPALAEIQKVLQLDSSRTELFNLQGALNELRGDLSAARRMYRVALALDPGYKPAVENLHRVCKAVYSIDGINYGDIAADAVSAASFAL